MGGGSHIPGLMEENIPVLVYPCCVAHTGRVQMIWAAVRQVQDRGG